MSRPPLWKPFVLVASYIFYGSADPRFCFLLAGVTLANQAAAELIHRAPDQRTKKRLMIAAVAIDLGVLGVFKYYGFFVEELNAALDNFSLGLPAPIASIALPIGVSFYTFQAISYVVDLYRGIIDKPAPTIDLAVEILQQARDPVDRRRYRSAAAARVGGLIAGLLVAAIGGFFLLGAGGGTSAEDVRATLEAADCTMEVEAGGAQHVGPLGLPEPGRHEPPLEHRPADERPALRGDAHLRRLTEPAQLARIVHNLEHGAVDILYGDDVPEATVSELQAFYASTRTGPSSLRSRASATRSRSARGSRKGCRRPRATAAAGSSPSARLSTKKPSPPSSTRSSSRAPRATSSRLRTWRPARTERFGFAPVGRLHWPGRGGGTGETRPP